MGDAQRVAAFFSARLNEPWCLACVANFVRFDPDAALEAVNEIKRRFEGLWGPRTEFQCRGCGAVGVETWAMRGEMLEVIEEHYLKDDEGVIDEAGARTA